MTAKLLALLAAGGVLMAFSVWSAWSRGSDHTRLATVPAYAAGYARAADPPALDAAEVTRRLGAIEAKLDALPDVILAKLTKELESDRSAPASPSAAEGASGAGAGTPLYFRALSRSEEGAVIRQVERNRMPPPDSGVRLTPGERRAILDAFSGRAADEDQLAAAGFRCAGCHQEALARAKGGDFVLLEPRSPDRSPSAGGKRP